MNLNETYAYALMLHNVEILHLPICNRETGHKLQQASTYSWSKSSITWSRGNPCYNIDIYTLCPAALDVTAGLHILEYTVSSATYQWHTAS